MNEKLTMRPSIEGLALKSSITDEGVNDIVHSKGFFSRIFLIFHVFLLKVSFGIRADVVYYKDLSSFHLVSRDSRKPTKV